MTASGPRFVIRPAEAGDLEALESLISQVRVGITSLAIDRQTLLERIEQSLASFSTEVHEPGDERYFFVLERQGSHEIVGMSAVRAAVGLVEAFYSYRVGTEVHASRELGIHRQLPALYLSNDYTGCAELGDEGLVSSSHQVVCGGEIHCEEVLSKAIPKRRTSLAIRDASNLGDHFVGETVRKLPDEQEPRLREQRAQALAAL